jgi:hypothetical protein
MRKHITTDDLFAITVATANRIAAQHEDDPDWDFWAYMEEVDEHVQSQNSH